MTPLFPDFIDDRQESPGRGYFGFIRTFSAGYPVVKAAQVKIRPDGRPDCFHSRPTQPAIAGFDNLPVMGPVAGAARGRNDARIGMEVSRVREPGQVRDLHRDQDRQILSEPRDRSDELSLPDLLEELFDQFRRLLDPCLQVPVRLQ